MPKKVPKYAQNMPKDAEICPTLILYLLINILRPNF